MLASPDYELLRHHMATLAAQLFRAEEYGRCDTEDHVVVEHGVPGLGYRYFTVF